MKKLIFSTVLLLAAAGCNQQVQNSSSNNKTATSDWLTYTNTEFGFTFQYPLEYSKTDGSKGSGFQNLITLQRTKPLGFISVTLVHSPFSLNSIRTKYAPTGNENLPKSLTIEQNTFYYYGLGGGGVAYPDQYFFNFNGQISLIAFQGPDDPGHNTPNAATKIIEAQLLSTFKFIK